MILAFGKNGQVGRELHKIGGVECLDRSQVNLTNPSSCFAAILNRKPSAVINAAAYTSVDNAENESEEAFLINAKAPEKMAQACSYLRIPFIHISTDYVFDGSGETAWKPDERVNPQNIYGKSKLAGEKLIQQQDGIYAILRTSWIVSSYGKNFIKSILSIAAERDRVCVVDDQIGGPTPAHNIANACIEIAGQLIISSSKSGIYHFSGRPNVSWCEFANEIFQKVGTKTRAHPIPSSQFPTVAMRPLNSRLNCELLEETFNIKRPLWRRELVKILKNMGY